MNSKLNNNNYNDIIGKQYGRWNVIGLGEKIKGKQYMICECSCDDHTIKSVYGNSLIKGKSTSCGCLKKEYMQSKYNDLTGQQFGNLIVLKKSSKRTKYNKIMWTCQCTCEYETIIDVSAESLTNGKRKTCGKCRKANNFVDLTGQKFGRLTVLKRDKSSKKIVYWLCECDCESKTRLYVLGSSLKSGKTKSCGCLHSEISSQLHGVQEKYNDFIIGINYIIGITQNGSKFYFDHSDLDKIKNSQRCWFVDEGYVVCKYKGKSIQLQNYLMNPPENMLVDHIDGNPLNNCRKNLRICTKFQNAQNHKTQKNNTSGHKGVWWHKNYSKWCVQIGCNNERIIIGYYDDFKEAVIARKDAELKYHKEFSNDR